MLDVLERWLRCSCLLDSNVCLRTSWPDASWRPPASRTFCHLQSLSFLAHHILLRTFSLSSPSHSSPPFAGMLPSLVKVSCHIQWTSFSTIFLTSKCSWLGNHRAISSSILQSPFFQGYCLVSIRFPNQCMEHYPHKVPFTSDDVPESRRCSCWCSCCTSRIFLLASQEHYLHSLNTCETYPLPCPSGPLSLNLSS